MVGSGAWSCAQDTRAPRGKIAAVKSIALSKLRPPHRIAGLGSRPQFVEMLNHVVILQKIESCDHAVIAQQPYVRHVYLLLLHGDLIVGRGRTAKAGDGKPQGE